MPELRFCDHCKVHQPYRTKHCDKCERCVHKFDHHCFWMGGCIGELNHGKFWLFLFFQTILQFWAYQIVKNDLKINLWIIRLIQDWIMVMKKEWKRQNQKTIAALPHIPQQNMEHSWPLLSSSSWPLFLQ